MPSVTMTSPLDRHFPLGAAVTSAQLEDDPHPVLAAPARARAGVLLPGARRLAGDRHDLALKVMRDPATYTVDDRRFSTAQVIGPSMLSLDGIRTPVTGRRSTRRSGRWRSRERFADATAQEADRLIAELGRRARRASPGFAGPLAAAIVTHGHSGSGATRFRRYSAGTGRSSPR